MLGKLINKGNTRIVYEYELNPEYVIKVAIGEYGYKSNRYEWSIWSVNSADTTQWLVPCIEVFEGYKYLIMERGIPISDSNDNPHKIINNIPNWLCNDIMLSNWVYHDNKPKLCDYGNINIINRLKLN